MLLRPPYVGLMVVLISAVGSKMGLGHSHARGFRGHALPGFYFISRCEIVHSGLNFNDVFHKIHDGHLCSGGDFDIVSNRGCRK